MKKIILSLLLVLGVTFAASAQSKFDKKVQASVVKTVEVVAEEKGYSEEQQKIIYDALTKRWDDGKALFAKKLPTEEHNAEQNEIIAKCKETLNTKVEPNCGNYILNISNKLRKEAIAE